MNESYDYEDINLLQLDPFGGIDLRTGFVVSLRSEDDFTEEPPYTRTRRIRHDNYRSATTNLEMHQFLAALKILQKSYSELLADIKTLQTLYDEGGTIPLGFDITINWNSPIQYDDPPTNTIKSSDVEFGYQNIAARLDSLAQRVRTIENGRI